MVEVLKNAHCSPSITRQHTWRPTSFADSSMYKTGAAERNSSYPLISKHGNAFSNSLLHTLTSPSWKLSWNSPAVSGNLQKNTQLIHNIDCGRCFESGGGGKLLSTLFPFGCIARSCMPQSGVLLRMSMVAIRAPRQGVRQSSQLPNDSDGYILCQNAPNLG